MITHEMIDSARAIYVAWSATDRPHSAMFRDLYETMRALDPEVERMRRMLAQACEMIADYPADWADLARPRYAQPCDQHEYIQSDCTDCGRIA